MYEGEVAQDFSGGGVDGGGVQVLEEDHEAGSVVMAADVVQASGATHGDDRSLVKRTRVEVAFREVLDSRRRGLSHFQT